MHRGTKEEEEAEGDVLLSLLRFLCLLSRIEESRVKNMAASCGGGVLPSSSGQYHLQANTKAVASSVGGASGNSVLPICSKRGSENNSKKQSLLSQTFVPAVGPKFSRGLAKGNNNGAAQEHRSLVSGLRGVPHLSLSLSVLSGLTAALFFFVRSGTRIMM